MLVWLWDQLGLTQESTQTPSLKGSRIQVTKSKTLQTTAENQAKSQAVQEPVMGWRHMVKSPSLCPRCQSETASVPSGFWCSSSLRKMRLRFLPVMQANISAPVSVLLLISKIYSCSYDWFAAEISWFVFCFKSFPFPLFYLCHSSSVSPVFSRTCLGWDFSAIRRAGWVRDSVLQ